MTRFRNALHRVRLAFYSAPDPTLAGVPLTRGEMPALGLDRLTRGIDNIHVDVRLSPSYMSQARKIIVGLLSQEAGRGAGERRWSGPSTRDWEDFRERYAKMVETATHRAKGREQEPVVPLLQLASLKFLLNQVQTELDEIRESYRGSLSLSRTLADAERVRLDERLGWLARNRPRLRVKVLLQIFEQISKVEAEQAKLRQSLLGQAWPVPEAVLFNPLLAAESPFDDEILMKYYVLLGQDESEDLLRALLVKNTPASPTDWSSTPANVDVLFNVELTRQQRHAARRNREWSRMKTLTAQLKMQHRWLAMVERRFRSTGVLNQVIASYEVAALSRDYTGLLNPQQLRSYLSEKRHRKALDQLLKDRLKAQETGHKTLMDSTASVDRLRRTARHVEGLSCAEQRQYLVRFLRDFVAFRRDLAFYQLVHDAIKSIHVQENAQHVRLSATNNTLYEFLGSDERQTSVEAVLGHVVLKADVRGSTTIVSELRQRGLNPASHFSLNLFDPITDLVSAYGATKIFVEGDAVILGLLEYQETQDRLCVARACGLAKRLLSVVQAQNAVSQKHGLPPLELGIGLVYGAEAPTFLYDGETPIMISSAIGMADRLCSCSWLLRKYWRERPQRYTSIEVYELPEGHPLRGEKGQKHLRFNVNGIELDRPAFTKLHTEIALQRFELRLPENDDDSVFYGGRYPDLRGNIHRVVIREGRIRLYDERAPHLGRPTEAVFFEVITHPLLLEQAESALKPR